MFSYNITVGEREVKPQPSCIFLSAYRPGLDYYTIYTNAVGTFIREKYLRLYSRSVCI